MRNDIELKDVDALILCGGLGTRLRTEIGENQKVMADLGGVPFLEMIINSLKEQGIRRVILCTGYKSESVESYFNDKDFGLDIAFSVEKEPLGTGGAVKNAFSFIKSDCFFALNGDSFCDVKFDLLLKFHKKEQLVASLVVSRIEESKDYGVISLDDKHNVLAFNEKAQQSTESYVNAGIYCFDKRQFLNLMPELKNFSLEYDCFPKLIGNNFKGFIIDEKFSDIGTPERYKEIKQTLSERGEG